MQLQISDCAYAQHNYHPSVHPSNAQKRYLDQRMAYPAFHLPYCEGRTSTSTTDPFLRRQEDISSIHLADVPHMFCKDKE
jgi:hypothetical protein